MRSTIVASKLDTTQLTCRRIHDVWIEGVHIVVLLGKWSIELIAQPKVDSQLLGEAVIILDISGEVVQVLVEYRISRTNAGRYIEAT